MDKTDTGQRIELYVNFLYPGIVLKGDAFTLMGEKINDSSVPFTAGMIGDLKTKGIQRIFYQRPVLTPKSGISKPSVDQPVINEAVNVVQELENAVKTKSILPQKEIDKVAGDFVDNISSRDDSVLNLLALKDIDDYTYTHSINVTLIAIMLAKKIGYGQDGLKILATAGLLHDIGKTLLPKEIITKPAEYTDEEFEIFKKHPVYGYEIIKSYSGYPDLIQKIVLLHHEKVSGKGYPFGLRGEQMGEAAQIIALADMFDSNTNPRVGLPARPFWYTLTQINKESGSSFAPRLAKTFTNEMPYHITEGEIFKKGAFVTLNTGEIAEVVDYEYPQSLSPYVDIYINSKKEIVRMPVQINLEYDDTRYITQVIQDENALSKLLEIRQKVGGTRASQKEAKEAKKLSDRQAAAEEAADKPEASAEPAGSSPENPGPAEHTEKIQ
ncbi:MAG: HD-GYP domain-containing protein [Brevinematales bacterium]|jgi:putative nucleotidyltransferase with HDIG domain